VEPFFELQAIWNRHIAGDKSRTASDVVALLYIHGIRLRLCDGYLRQLTVSIPTSVCSGYAIGVRYEKKDGSHTEDLFAVEPARRIRHYPKGALQREWPEYKNTHKQQVDFALVANENVSMSSVNTISVVTS
jgi:hypothetical protein